MPLTPANLMASGYIIPCRFVRADPSSTPVGAGGATSQPGFKCTQAIGGDQTIGISQDSTNYPPINDPSISVLPVAAAPGQSVKIFGQGTSDCLLEMCATCNEGDYLMPDNNSATDSVQDRNITLSTPGTLNDPNAGRGRPVVLATTGLGPQWYGARALQPCTAVGEKIRVEVVEGWYTKPTTP
jgi:hypothetical protein